MRPLVWLLLLAGCDRSTPTEVVAAWAPPTVPAAPALPVKAPPPPPPIAAPAPARGEGAASPREVYARAQRAVERGDFAELYRCVAPRARDGWMRQMVLGVMFATMGKMGSPLDQIMQRQHATLTVEQRLAGLDVEQMSDALLAHVDDRAALFGDLMTYARANGGAADPMNAFPSQVVQMQIAPGKSLVDGISDAIDKNKLAPIAVSGPPGLPRLLALLGAHAPLGDAKVRGGAAGGTVKIGKQRTELRFVEQGAGPAWFIDES